MKPQKLEEIASRYSIDTREMGKLLVVASIVTFLASVQMVYALQDVQQDVGEASDNLSRVMGVIQTDRFQSSLETLRNDNRVGISQDTNIVANSLLGSITAVEHLEEAEQKSEVYLETYQYAALISVGGTVAGMTMMVM